MTTFDPMPRQRIHYRLDTRITDALEAMAGKGKTNQFVEGILFEFLKNTGRLPKDAAPLPEQRGGKRIKGVSKKTPQADPL